MAGFVDQADHPDRNALALGRRRRAERIPTGGNPRHSVIQITAWNLRPPYVATRRHALVADWAERKPAANNQKSGR
jgi:hypothetical protein